MKRRHRTLAYIAAGVAAGLVIGSALLYTVSRTEFGMERARRLALNWLAERVDGTVHIGSIGGRGLLGGVTLRDFSIIDKLGRPFMRADSATLAYNWRILIGGEIVVERATLFDPEVYFEQLPGDSIWNFQHVFPDRSVPGKPKPARRLILLRNVRIVNGLAIVRMPLETAADRTLLAAERTVIDTVPGGRAKVMRFDSLYGQLSRVIWESPIEKGKLFDIRALQGRGFVWREPMYVRSMRGTVTLRDTIVAFDIPDARFPSSSAAVTGRVVMEEGQNFFDVRVDSRDFQFRDLQWLYPRLPESGGGRGVLRIQSQRPKGVLWLATDTRIAAPGTRLAGSFGVVTGADSLYFTNVNLRASPLNLKLVQAVLPQKLPLDGLLVGTVEVKGGLSALDTRGDMQLADAAGTSRAKWHGRIDVRNGLGARDFQADVQTLDLALLNALRPSLNLKGRVTGHVEASGNIEGSVKFAADIHHYLSGFTSSFNGAGTYTGGAAPGVDVQLNALPLSLEQLAASYPALARLRGDVRGPIHVYGALDDLAVKADLQTLGGRAQYEGRLMLRGNTPRYTGDATLYSFRLDRIIAALPATTVDGTVTFDVTGRGAEDVAGTVLTQLSSGTIQATDFREGRLALTLGHGVARVDTLRARTFFGQLAGAGALGLSAHHSGAISFVLRSDSIAPLEPQEGHVAQTAGRVRGTGSVTGSVESFDLKANVDIEKLLLGDVAADRLSVAVTGTTLGGAAGRIAVRARADSLIAYGLPADSSIFAVSYASGRGDARVSAGSAAGDEYFADGGFVRSDTNLLFTLRELRLGKRSAPWQLLHPVAIATDDHGLSTDSVEIRRADGGRVLAAGRIAWHDASHAPEAGGRSDFRLDFTGVPFAEFALVTVGSSDLKGTLEGHVRVTGSAAAPVLDGDAQVKGFAAGDASLDQLSASFTYADQRINARVDAEKAGRRVLFADGLIPMNLAFLPVAERKLAEPLRFSIQADSLPATFLTSWVGGFSNVRGRLDGSLAASGTTAQPQLAGSLALRAGDASWDVTGVRYHDVAGTIRLDGARQARVDADVRTNGGGGHVTGTIDFKQLGDPQFELLMNAQNFVAAKRRDADFTASGNVQLRGRYRQPVVSGVVAVEQGSLYLDELYRRYQIIELDNPLLYDVVDTSLVSLRTILPRTLNPFVKNLIVEDLRVNVGREAWLRSRDLNVEVSGDLTIAFLLPDTLLTRPRTAQDLVLTGTLRAIRGTYQLAGPGIARQFAIREGTIEFPGTPGVDPNLAFNAVYRARSQRREPIDIIAVVGGTLRTPRIRLTSDEEPPISESDLASYLFFGAPTYELSSAQSAAVSQATSGLGQDVARYADIGVRALTSSGFGYLASGLQSVAQSYGLLDYVSLTAAETGPGIQTQNALATLFAGTQLEVGRYLGREGRVYVAYSQRLTTTGSHPGVRMEWRFVPSLTGEFFIEDRFAHSPDFGIQNAAVQKKVYGFFLYREWGY